VRVSEKPSEVSLLSFGVIREHLHFLRTRPKRREAIAFGELLGWRFELGD
jgi:hypothetical protein